MRVEADFSTWKDYGQLVLSWRPIVTQSSAEVLAKQDILCINRNTWLSQKISLDSTKKFQVLK